MHIINNWWITGQSKSHFNTSSILFSQIWRKKLLAEQIVICASHLKNNRIVIVFDFDNTTYMGKFSCSFLLQIYI